MNDVAFDLNKSDYVMAINRTGAFDFELPKATGQRKVNLGEAGRYFSFDKRTSVLKKKDADETLPYGAYTIKVTNSLGEQSSSYSVIFLVGSLASHLNDIEGPNFEKPDGTNPEPKIGRISDFGELEVKWSKPMILPEMD